MSSAEDKSTDDGSSLSVQRAPHDETVDELRRRVTARQISAGRPPPRPSEMLFGAADGSAISVPAELLSEIRESFEMYSDGGDRMNVRHLFDALRSMAVNVTDEDVMAVVDRYNADSDDHLDCGQWTAAVVARLAEDWDRRERFRALLEDGADDDDDDEDDGGSGGGGRGPGLVPVSHVRHVLETFDPASLTATDADEMVASTERAGYVNVDEFMDTMLTPARVTRFV